VLEIEKYGGEGGIRTLGTGVSPYNGLANRRIRPLCHLSGVRSYILPRLRRGPLPLQLHTFTYLWSYCTHSTGVVSLGVLGLVGEHMGSNPGFSIAEKKSDSRLMAAIASRVGGLM
jgi:hypothetical protein